MLNLDKFAMQVGRDIKSLLGITQDTGWRKITSGSLLSGHALVRRIGNMCYIGFGGGVWDTFSIAQSQRGSQKINITRLPTGFRSQMAIGGAVTKDGTSIVGQLLLTSATDESWIQIRSLPATEYEYLRTYLLSYPTSDPFPTSLPGTAA